jgi:Protein of unknown function (DUF2796)
MKRLICVSLFIPFPVFVDAESHAHVHGVATLEVAVEANKVTLLLDSPLDNLLGFEHTPRTDAERRQADDMVVTLRAGGTLFTIDPAAQCMLGNVELRSAALNLGRPQPEANDDGHADLDGSFEYICKDATRATYIETGLLDAFPRLQRIDVLVATSKGQLKRELKRPSKRIALSR